MKKDLNKEAEDAMLYELEDSTDYVQSLVKHKGLTDTLDRVRLSDESDYFNQD